MKKRWQVSGVTLCIALLMVSWAAQRAHSQNPVHPPKAAQATDNPKKPQSLDDLNRRIADVERENAELKNRLDRLEFIYRMHTHQVTGGMVGSGTATINGVRVLTGMPGDSGIARTTSGPSPQL